MQLPGVDLELPDPAGFGRPPGDPIYPPIRGHSGYLADPAYGRFVQGVLLAPDTTEPAAARNP